MVTLALYIMPRTRSGPLAQYHPRPVSAGPITVNREQARVISQKEQYK